VSDEPDDPLDVVATTCEGAAVETGPQRQGSAIDLALGRRLAADVVGPVKVHGADTPVVAGIGLSGRVALDERNVAADA